MARLPRLILPGLPHHIIQRGLPGMAIVRTDADRRAWREAVGDVLDLYPVKLHAYVLMDDQFQLLVTPDDAQALSRFMQALGRRHVGSFNTAHQRTGTLWEGRFRGCPLEPERHFLAAMHCIELLPVRCGAVTRAEDWTWSSAAHHLGLRRDSLVTEHPLYWALGNTPFDRQTRYRMQLDAGLSEREVRAHTEAALKGWALGSDAFMAQHRGTAKRPLVPRSKGRPAGAGRLKPSDP